MKLKLLSTTFFLFFFPFLLYGADGDKTGESKDRWAHYILIDAAVAINNGVWVYTDAYTQGSISVEGITTATVTINGSDSTAAPANSVHKTQLASMTADGIVTITPIPRWIKARVSAWTAGTVTVTIRLAR